MNIEELKKGGQLTEIEINEVSLVESPAVGRRFVFTKAADFTFEISTNQTFPGTTVKVNGEELKNLDSFRIWLDDVSEEDMEEWGAEPFSASWTLRESSEDGVDQVSTFSLQSTEVKKMEKSEILKALKAGYEIDIDEAAFDKLPVEKQTSLTGFATYATAMPEPFRKSQATAITALIAKDEAPAKTTQTGGEETPPETPPEAPAGLTEDKVKELIAAGIAEAAKPPEESGEEGGETEPTETEKQIAKMQADLIAIGKATGAKLSSETEVEKGAGAGADGWKDNWDVG